MASIAVGEPISTTMVARSVYSARRPISVLLNGSLFLRWSTYKCNSKSATWLSSKSPRNRAAALGPCCRGYAAARSSESIQEEPAFESTVDAELILAVKVHDNCQAGEASQQGRPPIERVPTRGGAAS
ncbi:unnamed protein product [Prorocentrum cordatum]|uniref:Uncharacterized protein n=1 Tax=Prorocentrum cordatum TaxID=2364126 RepID=A0ABN9W6R0_9DINO|nr:unnamed protein product [Polarella glacialis]